MKRSDIRQSLNYSLFMEKIGWKTATLVATNYKLRIFIKKIPLLGNFLKIPRPPLPVSISTLKKLAKEHRAFAIQVDYSPTKTLQINLNRPKEKIFNQFKKDARYGIKRAKRNRLVVGQSSDIETFIKIWHQNALRRGFWLSQRKEIRTIYDAFGKKAYLILAYQANDSNRDRRILAGALILIHDGTAHYFYATSTPRGKKLSASYFVVWEAIKLAKEKGCRIFDFEGIYDERFPQKSWKGFTHFKKSFGGREIEYPGSFTEFYHPILKFASKLPTPI